jgi:hypothetical protein
MVIDESSQVPTEALARLQSIASQAGAWTIQAGDTEQLPSPEAGGIMRLIAAEHGYVQIREVHRFREEWESAASLKLRAGDVSVIEEYKQRGSSGRGYGVSIPRRKCSRSPGDATWPRSKLGGWRWCTAA